MTDITLRLSNSIPESSNVSEIPNAFLVALLQFLTSSPYITCTVALSYISGHLWVYIILSYFSKKERKILYSLIGRLSLGLMWFAAVLIPAYIIRFKSVNIIGEQLFEILITVLVIALALQLIILFVVFFLHRRG